MKIKYIRLMSGVVAVSAAVLLGKGAIAGAVDDTTSNVRTTQRGALQVRNL